MSKSFFSGLLEELCTTSTREKFRTVFALSLFMVVLMVIWFPFVDRESATFVIVVMNLVSGGFILALSGTFIWGCPYLIDE